MKSLVNVERPSMCPSKEKFVTNHATCKNFLRIHTHLQLGHSLADAAFHFGVEEVKEFCKIVLQNKEWLNRYDEDTLEMYLNL